METLLEAATVNCSEAEITMEEDAAATLVVAAAWLAFCTKATSLEDEAPFVADEGAIGSLAWKC